MPLNLLGCEIVPLGHPHDGKGREALGWGSSLSLWLAAHLVALELVQHSLLLLVQRRAPRNCLAARHASSIDRSK